MPWLITYQAKAAAGTSILTCNEVTHDDPLVWLCKVQREWPKENYVLLSAAKVADGPHINWIVDENSGEPHGDALGEKVDAGTATKPKPGDFTCHVCKAPAGSPCVTRDGTARSDFHLQRGGIFP